ncbi:hypothetical protein F4677DRAFT_392738 [Hypoxylon crocopeplum]|nr:hypothetical protein F4677DRAFT_392738 [Hypoxylon crocopeplum]
MTAITKTTRGIDGSETALTYHMPAQTTPFAGPHDQRDPGSEMPPSCSLSVFCRGLSYYVYSMNTAAGVQHPLQGQHCLAVQTLDGPGPGPRVGYDEHCWPENYFALFANEWGDLNGAPRTAAEGDASTVAFPGDRCLAGWTTACTTTISGGGGDADLYPQAWCCPPGQWTCATATGEGDRQAPQRLCQSAMTGSTDTDVWMYWDPAFYTLTPDGSTTTLFEAYTWKAGVTGEPEAALAATVFRKVFPLALSSEPGLVGQGDETAAAVFTVTEIVTATAEARAGLQKRFPESSLWLPLGDSAVVSRYAVASLLGAAIVSTMVLLLGFALLYRARRNRMRLEATAIAAVRENGKLEKELLLQRQEVHFA